MTENMFTLPFNEVQKKVLTFTFLIVRHLLNEDTDNPFTQALDAYLDDYEDVNIPTINALMDKYEASTDLEYWHFTFTEGFSFYILFDVMGRMFRSGYFMNYVKDAHDETDDSDTFDLEGMNELSKSTLNLVETVLELLSNMKTNEFINDYMWQAERFPDPVTGISPQLMSYNHLPHIPQDPPQMSFNDYSDDIMMNLDLKVNADIVALDLYCVMSILYILMDAENPPALIIKAYFPTMEDEINELLVQCPVKNKRRKKWKVTEAEFGLMYACCDLYGRVHASKYNYLLEGHMEHPSFLVASTHNLTAKMTAEQRSAVVHLIELKIKASNQVFTDWDVVNDYRELASQMVWFDD